MSAAYLHSAHRSSGSAVFQQLMLPLQSVVNFFSPPAQSSGFSRSSLAALPARASIQHSVVGRVGNSASQASSNAAQILRSRRAQDGRIVISGRMRDVCAELDRLCSDPS